MGSKASSLRGQSARAHAKRNRVPNSTSSQKDYYLIRNNDVMSFPNRQAYAKKADMGKFITLDKLASKFMEVKKGHEVTFKVEVGQDRI